MMTSMKKQLWLSLGALCLSLTPLSAHEGHDVPGALPPAPHGGVVKEAEHKVAHAHDKNEAEVFLEVKFGEGKLEIFPLLLEPTNTATFKNMTTAEFAVSEVKVEYPRTKKTETIKVNAEGNGFSTTFAPKSPGRFFVLVSGTHNKEVKTAKLQVEPK